MSTPTVPEQNWTQYNFNDGDTNEVIIKQNGFNESLALFQTAINNMVAALNEDVALVEQAREELDAENIVHVPGSGLPNAAGEAYSRGVVGGGGDLMAQGAFGIGGRVSVSSGDLNTFHVNGLYAITSGNVLNRPVSLGTLIVGNRNNEENPRTVQVYLADEGAIYSRYFNGSDWSGWRMVYDSFSILGTVSQSGGVPTGALFEYGSNSNGEWYKYADGTCRVMLGTAASAVGANISNVNAVRSLPVVYSSFIGNPRLMISARLRRYGDMEGQPVSARCVNLHGEFIPASSEVRIVADFSPSLQLTLQEAYSISVVIEGRWY